MQLSGSCTTHLLGREALDRQCVVECLARLHWKMISILFTTIHISDSRRQLYTKNEAIPITRGRSYLLHCQYNLELPSLHVGQERGVFVKALYCFRGQGGGYDRTSLGDRNLFSVRLSVLRLTPFNDFVFIRHNKMWLFNNNILKSRCLANFGGVVRPDNACARTSRSTPAQ